MSSLNNTVDLSVIIPLYKGKTFIEQTVLSIREIKCSKEIIIVDDGSPDDSYDFCTKQFCDFEEVSIIQKKNGGIVDARNFGLSKATGRYVMFSDQDDICFAETIQKAVKLAMEQNIDMVYWLSLIHI